MRQEAERLADMEIERRKELGQRIKDLRHGKRVPQRVVADQLDVALRTVQAWEAGEFPPEYDNLERLANYFKVPEDFILSGEQPQDPDAPTQLDRIEALLIDNSAKLVENSAKLDLLYSVATGEMPSDVITEAWLALADTRESGEPVAPGTEAPSGARRAVRQVRS